MERESITELLLLRVQLGSTLVKEMMGIEAEDVVIHVLFSARESRRGVSFILQRSCGGLSNATREIASRNLFKNLEGGKACLGRSRHLALS